MAYDFEKEKREAMEAGKRCYLESRKCNAGAGEILVPDR